MENPFFITTQVSNKLSEREYKNLLKNLTSIILGTKLVVNPSIEKFNLVVSRTTPVQNSDINRIIESINLDGTTFDLSQDTLNKIAELGNIDRLLSEKLSKLEGVPKDLTKNLGELQIKALLSKSIIQLQDKQKQELILSDDKFEKENIKLKQDLENARKELADVQKKAVEKLDSSDKTKEQIRDLLNQLEQAQRKISELEQELLNRQEQITALQEEKQKVETNRDEWEKYANESIAFKDEELRKTQDEINKTKEDLIKAQEEVTKADARVKQTVESAIANINKEKSKGETLLNLVSLLNEKVANVNKLLV